MLEECDYCKKPIRYSGGGYMNCACRNGYDKNWFKKIKVKQIIPLCLQVGDKRNDSIVALTDEGEVYKFKNDKWEKLPPIPKESEAI